MNILDWNLYYNKDSQGQFRANLVYTPYVSPDGKIFCMSFNRDPAYHTDEKENKLWTEEHLQDRFDKELRFHKLASTVVPTLSIIEVDYTNRQIFIEWTGLDFYMLGLESAYENILPDWQEQWLNTINKLRSINVSKFSLHPNSWVVKDNVLIPFNWFFCYNRTDGNITIRELLRQISNTRQDKLVHVLEKLGMTLDTPYTAKQLESVCFNSFRSNYPDNLINKALEC